jgi:hypothetical protein
LESALLEFNKNFRSLPGIQPHGNRLALVEQLLESIRRVRYVRVIREKTHSPLRADPRSDLFDPIKAAVLHQVSGNVDEACWLVFLSTHFGKHNRTGWRLARDVYGALGGTVWSWDRISSNPDGLAHWLEKNYDTLVGDGIPRRFGNHRKYETLRATSNKGTGSVVASYACWVNTYGSHTSLFENSVEQSEGTPRAAFRYLYDTMDVLRFGRTAKFDYLTMIANLGLAPIEADSPYLVGATGPLRGARLLVGGNVSARLSEQESEDVLVHLADLLHVGMQEIEDALCNWQKSPSHFVPFRG